MQQAAMTAQTEKNIIRHAILKILRAAMHGGKRARHSKQLRKQLLAALANSPSLQIGIYAGLAHEIDLLPLLDEAPQHHYSLPRCGKANSMEFHRIEDSSQQLELDAHQILTPPASCTIIAAKELDIIICPGIAFTSRGERLGYGGGYYDRYLPRAPRAKRIALAHPCQIIESIPSDPHDIRIQQLYISQEA